MSNKGIANSNDERRSERLDSVEEVTSVMLCPWYQEIWKQALYVCHKWSATLTETSPSEGLVAQSLEMQKEGDLQRVASSCLETEHQFLSEVESAEELLSHLGPLDNNAEMPDAMEIVFQTALALGRKGVVYELLEEMDNATTLYLKSINLLSFFLVEISIYHKYDLI